MCHFAYKLGKLPHRQNGTGMLHFAYGANYLQYMCHLAYELSVGKMQNFSGSNVCILPTDIHPGLMS
jgi:hypothetical protein